MRDAPDQEFLALQQALAGRYSLERELGRGGMGIVYLAREVRLDRPVALKLLPPVYAEQSALRDRFLREARTAARLSHPHIVPVHAVDEAGDFVFIVMAYVQGETLEQRVQARGPLPATEAARLLRELAWALAYAHAQGVVHRDIKPGNILLEAGSGRALVSDFGIAQVSDLAAGSPGEMLGTAEYMSPEQASGGAVDGRSDLYALGVVGYFMLSGRVPFEGATSVETLAKQIALPALPLLSIVPETPAALAQAIDRCLAKAPDARFADGEQLAEALGRAIERRQEVPIALRMFAERVQESSRSLVLMFGMSLVFLATAAMIASDAPGAVVGVITFVGLLFGATPVAMLLHVTRRLLRSGYGHDELLRAIRGEVAEMREALASQPTTQPSRWDRLLGPIRNSSLGTYVAGLGYMMSGLTVPAIETILGPVMALSGIGFLGAGLYSGAKQVIEGRPRGERWLKFWDSRAGRALFRISGLGLKPAPSAGASYRPTELAIAMAADRLFEELPAELRKSLGDLPPVVRALEQHAEQARARCAELNAILNDIQPAGGADVRFAQRGRLSEDVRQARDAAEQRLAEVVGALETIRLQLLRMHAGMGSVASMTADLSAARELSADIEHMVDAARDIDELLGIRREAHGDTPVPA